MLHRCMVNSGVIYGKFFNIGLYSVVVLHRSMVDWRGYVSLEVYVHSSICETYLV